jgi:hypothetical protein
MRIILSRFAEPVTDKYIAELINNHENKNTKKNTGWAVGVFEKWRNFRNTGANIANIPFDVRCTITPDTLTDAGLNCTTTSILRCCSMDKMYNVN